MYVFTNIIENVFNLNIAKINSTKTHYYNKLYKYDTK